MKLAGSCRSCTGAPRAQLCRQNATYILSGHANGCVLWHQFFEPKPETDGYMELLVEQSYCPPCALEHGPTDPVKHVSVAKIIPKQRKMAAVAVTESGAVLSLRDRGRHPHITQVGSKVLHVYHENRQVRPVPCACKHQRRASAHRRHASSETLCFLREQTAARTVGLLSL